MNTYIILNPEFIVDELGYGYSSMTDSERLSSLSLRDIVKIKNINIRDIKAYLTMVGKWFMINESTTQSAKEAVFNMKEFDPHFNMKEQGADTILTTMLNALISDGLIDNTDKGYILGLGSELITRAEQIGISDINIGMIKEAR